MDQSKNSAVSNQKFRMDQWPDVVQDLIVQYLPLVDFSNLQQTSKYFHKFCNQNYVWWEKCQCIYNFPNIISKYTEIDWKQTIKRYSKSCDGKYFNTGRNSSLEDYKFIYTLVEDKQEHFNNRFGRIVTGKGGSFEILGVRMGDDIIYFQLKPESLGYYAIVHAKVDGEFIYCRWITSFNHGIAVSKFIPKEDPQPELMKSDDPMLTDLTKRVSDIHSLTSSSCPWKSGTYCFEKNGKGFSAKIEFFHMKLYGWGFNCLHKGTKFEGIVTDHFFTIAISRPLPHIGEVKWNALGIYHRPDQKGNMEGICALYESSSTLDPKFTKSVMKFIDQ